MCVARAHRVLVCGHDGDLQYENARAYAGRVYWPESARGYAASVTLNIYSARTATDEDSSWFEDGREKVATLMIWSGEVCVVRVYLHSLVLLSVMLACLCSSACALCCRSPMLFFIDRLCSVQLHGIITLLASCGAGEQSGG